MPMAQWNTKVRSARSNRGGNFGWTAEVTSPFRQPLSLVSDIEDMTGYSWHHLKNKPIHTSYIRFVERSNTNATVPRVLAFMRARTYPAAKYTHFSRASCSKRGFSYLFRRQCGRAAVESRNSERWTDATSPQFYTNAWLPLLPGNVNFASEKTGLYLLSCYATKLKCSTLRHSWYYY